MDNRRSSYVTPRWVKVFGIVVIVVLLSVGIHLIGMSFFGHAFGGHAGNAPSPGVHEHGRQHS